MLLLYFVAAGVLLGLATGGRPDRLAQVRIAWWPVALGALAFQVVLFSQPVAERVGTLGPALYVGSTLLVVVALLLDRHLPGFPVIALGAAMNLAAIVATGGYMPASPEAFAALTGRPAVPAEHYSNSTVARPDTPLAFLGDIFVLPRPFPFANVFSPGDVVIGVGVVVFLVRSMRPSPGAAGESAREGDASIPLEAPTSPAEMHRGLPVGEALEGQRVGGSRPPDVRR